MLITILSAQFPLYAQQTTVTGTVTDSSNNNPLTGASVRVKEMPNIGTFTTETGAFNLSVPAAAKTLIISYVGYKTIEVPVTDNVIIIKLQQGGSLDDIVVTGSISPRTKLESSVAVTSYNAKAITQMAPQSAAALLQHVPGFLVEASGGTVGNNLFARGIPAAGGYQFVQIQEDGMPVFEDGELQFGNADNWFRIDETTARMEAVRGGSGSIFATNAPGGIINFISKTGTNDFSGDAKLSVGTSGLFRTDFNISGALIKDKLFYDIGGFYRVDNGIRNPGYKADNGGQIRMNFQYNINGGYVKLYYKKLNDKDLFLLPIPLTNAKSPKGFNGFDASHGTLASLDMTHLSVPQYDGGTFDANLQNGVHPDVNVIGAEIKKDLGSGFYFNNNTRYTDINLDYNAIFPGANPQTAADFAATYTTSNGQSFPVSDPVYTYMDGSIANPQYVAKVGYWYVGKKMYNFANNLSFGYKNDLINLNFGAYYSNWQDHQYWNWSNYLIEVSDHAKLLNLVDGSLNSGDPNYSRTYNGISDMSFLIRDAQMKGDITALFANATINATKALTFDLGVRYDMDHYSGYNDNTNSVNLNNANNPNGYDFKTTTADESMVVSTGPYYYWKYNINRASVSAAANLKLTDNMAAYFRYSNGFRSPDEGTLHDNAHVTNTLKPITLNQYELGYKYQQSVFDVFANFFYSRINGVNFNDVAADGSTENKFAKSKTLGLELEADVHSGGFALNLSGTIQNPTYTDFTGKNADGTSFDYTHNQVQRIPKFYGTLTPSYTYKGFSVFIEGDYFGKKFADNSNLVVLPHFATLNAGASYTIKNVRFAVNGSNLTNTIGLTEGNPRLGDGTSVGDVYYARPIQGAFGQFSVTVHF